MPKVAPVETSSKRYMLTHYVWKRHGFYATVGRISYGGNPPTQWLILNDVCNCNGTLLTDHVWVQVTDKIRRANLRPGQTIFFEGTVRPYPRQPERNYEICAVRNIKPR